MNVTTPSIIFIPPPQPSWPASVSINLPLQAAVEQKRTETAKALNKAMSAEKPEPRRNNTDDRYPFA